MTQLDGERDAAEICAAFEERFATWMAGSSSEAAGDAATRVTVVVIALGIVVSLPLIAFAAWCWISGLSCPNNATI